MEYNKKKQPYTIEGRFQILEKDGEVEYCRVRFFNTNHVQVVKNELVKTGEFEDLSLNSIVKAINNAPQETVINDMKISLDGIVKIEPQEDLEDDATQVIAINPQGNEIEVEDLESFCEDNKLDIEVVNAVLEGKQKTHRKWKFKSR